MGKFNLVAGLALSTIILFACGSGSERKAVGANDYREWATSRTFFENGRAYTPADFEQVNLDLKFSAPESVARGVSEIEFTAVSDGYAYFLSEADILNATLDGLPTQIQTRRDPDNVENLRVISAPLLQGTPHRLRLEYQVPVSRVGFTNGGVNFLTTMSDLGRGNFFEAYAPASFEFDAFALDLNLEIVGGSSPRPHSIFANGNVTQSSATSWKISFPGHFTSSSFYVHLTNTPVHVRTGTYQGQAALIPLTIYSRDSALAGDAISRLPALFQELESTYGPYAHSSFIAYISGSGGMEHSGATITSVSALGHELTHSWFARGVMPSDGRSGWIDEAIASWRDNGYFRANQVGSRAPTNLSRISAFQRFTVYNAYVDGRNLLSEIDFLFAAQGGLRPVLKDFYAAWKGKSIRVADFRFFLEEKSGINLGQLFQKYVYADTNFPGDSTIHPQFRADETLHPPPLTEEEIRQLR